MSCINLRKCPYSAEACAFPFLLPDNYNADRTAGAEAAVLDHEVEYAKNEEALKRHGS